METAKTILIILLITAFLISLGYKSTSVPPATDQSEHSRDITERAINAGERAVQIAEYWKERAEKCEQSKGKK